MKAISLNRHGVAEDTFTTREKVLGWAASIATRGIFTTMQWKITSEGETRTWPHHSPVILAFWHGQQIAMIKAYWGCVNKKDLSSPHPIFGLFSEHGDGRIAARAMQLQGIDSVAGSSTRGGAEAILTLIKLMKDNCHIAMAVDGPRGPLYKAKPGTIKIAQRTGAAILPVGVAGNNTWRVKSWDKLLVPKPFSKMVIRMGEPLYVPKKLTDNEFTTQITLLEKTLFRLTEEAEKDPFLHS